MNLKVLLNDLEMELYILYEGENYKKFFQKLFEIFSSRASLHYLWCNVNENLEQIKIKVIPDNRIYYLLFDLLGDRVNQVFFVIDQEILNEETKDVLLELRFKSLLNLLSKYYWELDEIYIVDPEMHWMISVNHMFEFIFIGEISRQIAKEVENNKDLKQLIIENYNL